MTETAAQGLDTATWGNIALRDKAMSLLDSADARTGGAINSARILKHIGFGYFEFKPNRDTQTILGAIDHEAKSIILNEEVSAEERHFTLAHEIGHAILHPNESAVDFRKSPRDIPHSCKEREAFVFAYELTMPYEDFVKAYNEYSGNIEWIAKKFFVAPKRVEKRLEFLRRQIEEGRISDFTK